MSFLSKAIKKVESDQQKNSPLFACVMGVQGSGKSSCVATFDLPTLVFRTKLEYHGTQNLMSLAKKRLGKKAEITEIVINDGESQQEAWKKFIGILDELIEAEELPYKVIMIDSITDLQLSVIKETDEWKELCKTNGKYNKFNEPDAHVAMFKIVMEKLAVLNQDKGLHIVIIMAAQMQTVGDDGLMAIARPAIDGVKVASFINKSCGTVVFVNKTVSDENGVEHSFCFDSSVKQESKDKIGRISKTENFNIRVQGLTTDQLPETMPADFKKLLALRS